MDETDGHGRKRASRRCGTLNKILVIYAVIGLVIATVVAFGMRRR
jgi:hypothetical protein